MVNGLIKINSDLAIDFSFVDKILLNMVGIKKDKLMQALKEVDLYQQQMIDNQLVEVNSFNNESAGGQQDGSRSAVDDGSIN